MSIHTPSHNQVAAGSAAAQYQLGARWSARSLLLVSLLSLLIGALGIAFRIYEFRNFAALPTGFDGPLVFRQRYLLEHGLLLLSPIPTYSYWSGVINAQLGSYVMEVINAGILSVADQLGVAPRVIHQSVLTFLLSGLGIAVLLRGRAASLRLRDVALVAAMLTVGTPVALNFLNGWNVAYAWALLLAVTLVYVSDLPPTARLALSIMLTFIGPPLYHSFGFLLTVYIVLLWLIGGFLRFKHSVASPATVGVYYLTYQIYMSTVFFGALVKGLIDVATLDFLKRDAPVIAVSRIDAGLLDLQQLHIILYGLLSIPILIVLSRFARILALRWRKQPLPAMADDALALQIAITALSCAVGMFAVMFGLKFSVEFMINRGASYLIIPATLAMIYELRRSARAWRYIAPIAAVCVGISFYSFHIQSGTVHTATNYTQTEAEGYTWFEQRLRPDDVVFTDFRLSGAFIADGHLRVLGITGEGNEATDELLQEIYYSGDAGAITAGIDRLKTSRDGRPVQYLFLSTLMQQDYPGLNGYSSRFEPAPASFFAALDGSTDWRLIYTNDQIRIYERQGNGS